MSATGVTALDHTVAETNAWLNSLDQELHLQDRHRAYGALRAVLHALRDRVPPEVAIKLGAQLPILIRGVYYEGWHAAGTPTKERHVDQFVEHIAEQLSPQFPLDPLTVARAVFEILWEKLDPGEFTKLMNHLPTELRNLQST